MKHPVSVYVCDDDPNFAASFSETVRRYIEKERECRVTVFSNAVSLMETWHGKTADIVFLDIDMPWVSGFEASECLKEQRADAVVIFVSGHDHYVYDAFAHDALWYLRKGDLSQLGMALDKALKKVDAACERLDRYFMLQTETCVVKLDVCAVVRIESKGHNIEIVSGDHTVRTCRCRLSDAEKQLYALHFIRVGSGYLVNARFVAKVTSLAVLLTDGTSLHIGRKYVDTAKEQFAAFLRSR